MKETIPTSYRNTPITGMQELPAQLLMSRMLKSKLPTTTALFQPKVQENVREKLEHGGMKCDLITEQLKLISC